ncbi:MAG TPA: beta-N-acetylhexosaminidase [Chitinophagaceae bacterium]|nr:beta-N-acetylhexosaminidase [Chitinophagaceae bacterium]HPH31382.1 beta-N-acetylhexosaminidase [Chitinophagaceae bacterium]
MRKIAIGLFLGFFTLSASTQTVHIIPQPASVKQPKINARFSISPATVLVLEGSNLDKTAKYINEYLEQFYQFKLNILSNTISKNAIRLNFERMDNALPGAYRLSVNGNGVYIAGDNEEGVFYGIQTLIQLLPVPDARLKLAGTRLDIPHVSVEDAPRFEYRGMHLDVGRHFLPVSFVKKYIDYLALHKLNTFHWHLTEDQGWRIEIKKYPELTKMGAWRNGTIIGRYPGKGNDNIPHGGFYTQQEIKEVVQYARERYVEVIPEIEMPGHSSAAIAAYPWLSCFPEKPTAIPANMISGKTEDGLERGGIKYVQETWGVFDDVFCAGKESTFEFLQNVIDEVNTLFPSSYFHLGADECPKTHWKKCEACQKRMKENNLKDEHELQSYFVQRIEKYLNSKGKKLIGWDEILEGGLAPNAVVMSWRGEAGGIEAAKQKHGVIMTPGNPVYFDHSQSENEDSITIGGYNPIEKVYAWDPVPAELNAEEGKYILGAQANVWTEYMDNPRKVEYMIFPRMAALSEVLWSKKENKNWTAFEKKLVPAFKRYDLWKANYSKAFYDIKSKVIPASSGNGVLWELTGRLAEKIIVERKGPYPSFVYTKPHPVTSSTTFSARNTKLILWQTFIFNKATGKKITLTTPPSKSYPGDGAFTLVNGVQNVKGLAKSKEFLGFSGADCEAVIDLGKEEMVSKAVVHTLRQTGSWIWQPLVTEVFVSSDGSNYESAGLSDDFKITIKGLEKGTMKVEFQPRKARYIKLLVKNWGEIPAGEPGAGNKAWLFVDEIELE